MPETCTPTYRCQTEAPMWLSGAHPALREGTVTRTVCAHWSGNCCYWSTEIQVKACPDDYYVYRLEGSPACNLRYCTGEWQRPWWQLRGGLLAKVPRGREGKWGRSGGDGQSSFHPAPASHRPVGKPPESYRLFGYLKGGQNFRLKGEIS